MNKYFYLPFFLLIISSNLFAKSVVCTIKEPLNDTKSVLMTIGLNLDKDGYGKLTAFPLSSVSDFAIALRFSPENEKDLESNEFYVSLYNASRDRDECGLRDLKHCWAVRTASVRFESVKFDKNGNMANYNPDTTSIHDEREIISCKIQELNFFELPSLFYNYIATGKVIKSEIINN